MSNQKQAVALTSMVASAGMTVGKLAVGLATGSLGVLSEGVHSLLDFVATAMTYAAVRVSDTPPDETHPYGHGKVESIAALAETALLFLTSAWIVFEAVQRLLSPQVEVEATWWSVGVIVASIVIDVFRARALSRVAKETNSQALEADALHFSSDILSSSVVLVGLGLVWLGYPKGDPIAAIGVALFVCLAGYRLGRRTIDTLIDAAPVGAAERVQDMVAAVPGVAGVSGVRVRPGGSTLFIDLDILVSRLLPPGRVAEVQDSVVRTIRAAMPEAEPRVRTQPFALDDETVAERVVAIAGHLGRAVHHVTVQRVGEAWSVAYDFETDGTLPLAKAHALSCELEAAIRAELGDAVEVETHIEPRGDHPVHSRDAAPATLAAIRAQLVEAVAASPGLHDVHALRVREADGRLYVVFHCHADAAMPVEDAHEAIDRVERRVRSSWPAIQRIVGHAEPAHAEA
ncbi:cation diffusion facilitator family transporter [Azospirillum sp. TSO35-2]|uniref:cation diffusion facilitator family transporter n=1 Tax=Azospirillum sp. TSO35-2 TaxID=716796 RepID=UPI000D61B03E|nr:cation diffusion facilitator family transporter [Azospirillum sp. TSO35-2]PWC36046.1 cation diffusion facilitator family transporter [Azospirillum sp. TSO35-2]